MKTYLIDCTKEFLAKSRPGIGQVLYEDGLNIDEHLNEIEVANWLLDTFGGQITVLKEKNMYKIKTPDYEWDGKYWELKSPKKRNSLQKLFRKGMNQTTLNRGGLVIDITHSEISEINLISNIDYVFRSYIKECNYIIVKKNNDLIKVLKKKK